MNKKQRHIDLRIEEINKLLDDQDIDIDTMEAKLDELIMEEIFPYEVEEGKVFGKRIIKKDKKENGGMKKSAMIASILGFCLVGTTIVYASNVLSRFTFKTNNKVVTVATTDNMTEDQAKEWANQVIDESNKSSGVVETLEPTEKHYASVEEAQKELDFPLILPSYLPEQFIQEKEVMVLHQPALNQTFVYIIFPYEAGQGSGSLSINIVKVDYGEGTSLTMREEPEETYTNSRGDKYEITREKDGDSQCLRAEAYIGDYEYSIFTNGVEEEAFWKMVDSVELDAYINDGTTQK